MSALPKRTRHALAVTLAAGLPALLALHALSFGRVPAGLEGGAAVEALRGVHLIVRRRFEVLSFAIGPSAETLWLYFVGASVELLGPQWISVVLPSILAAAAVVMLTIFVALRLDPEMPPAIPFLLSAGSVWLFHYGQVGLRAIAAPLFFLVVCLLLERAERPDSPARFHAATGFVLGLSLYAYSSCRVLPVAWLLWKGLQWIQEKDARARLKSALLAGLAGLSVASIPNLLFFLREPGEFLFRGYYVYRGDWWWRPVNVFWTALLPFHHPRFYNAWLGEGHNFDATAVTLTGAGVLPVDPVTAVAYACGLVLAFRGPRPAGLSYVLWVLGAGTLLLGTSGPSLTRLLLLQPAYVLIAALALSRAWQRRPRARAVLVSALLAPGALGAVQYAWTFGQSTAAQADYLPEMNALSARARDLADADPALRVLLVARRGKDIAKFYNYRHIARIWFVEGAANGPSAVAEAIRRFQPGVVLVERAGSLAEVAASLGAASGTGPFYEIRLPATHEGAGQPEPGNLRRLWNEIRR